MKLPLRPDASDERTRGQALVEFALILPVLILLLVLAVDFGRVFFGWVALNNATRIAASEAAINPDAWNGSGDPGKQAEYRQMVANDLNAINCRAPDGSAFQATDLTPTPDVPNPQFPTGFDLGMFTSVDVTCNFTFITPVVGAILGNPMTIAAESTFPIRGGIINGVPVGPAPPPPTPTCATGKTIPTLVGNTVAEARLRWTTVSGFTGAFLPAPGPDDNDIVTAQTTSPPTSPGDCAAAATAVTVTHTAAPSCTTTDVIVPNLLDLTVAQARAAWLAAGFTGSFTPVVGNDTMIVRSQSTSTGRTAGQCSTPSTLVTVSYGAAPAATCTAPETIGRTQALALSLYTGAGFTGTFRATGPSSGVVNSQSIVGGQPYPCTSNMTVQLRNP